MNEQLTPDDVQLVADVANAAAQAQLQPTPAAVVLPLAGNPLGDVDLGTQMADMVKALIVDTAASAPRSRQRSIGPSQIGEVCTRKIAYQLHDWPKANSDHDPWAAVQGTAVHAWMAGIFTKRDPERYRVEERVTIRQGHGELSRIGGSSDLFDTLTGTVWDWKLSGKSSIGDYRRHGPGQQYRWQGHLYGLGWENAGYTPRRVSICFLPRHHELEPYVWTEPYSREVAEQALARLDSIYASIYALDPEKNPDAWTAFSTDPKAKCSWCPWLKPGSTDLSAGCPGADKPADRPDPLESLIA